MEWFPLFFSLKPKRRVEEPTVVPLETLRRGLECVLGSRQVKQTWAATQEEINSGSEGAVRAWDGCPSQEATATLYIHSMLLHGIFFFLRREGIWDFDVKFPAS